MSYTVNEESLEDAVATLGKQFREQNPTITYCKLDYDAFSLTIQFRKTPKKRPPLMAEPSVTTVGGFLP